MASFRILGGARPPLDPPLSSAINSLAENPLTLIDCLMMIIIEHIVQINKSLLLLMLEGRNWFSELERQTGTDRRRSSLISPRTAR